MVVLWLRVRIAASVDQCHAKVTSGQCLLAKGFQTRSLHLNLIDDANSHQGIDKSLQRYSGFSRRPPSFIERHRTKLATSTYDGTYFGQGIDESVQKEASPKMTRLGASAQQGYLIVNQSMIDANHNSSGSKNSTANDTNNISTQVDKKAWVFCAQKDVRISDHVLLDDEKHVSTECIESPVILSADRGWRCFENATVCNLCLNVTHGFWDLECEGSVNDVNETSWWSAHRASNEGQTSNNSDADSRRQTVTLQQPSGEVPFSSATTPTPVAKNLTLGHFTY